MCQQAACILFAHHCTYAVRETSATGLLPLDVEATVVRMLQCKCKDLGLFIEYRPTYILLRSAHRPCCAVVMFGVLDVINDIIMTYDDVMHSLAQLCTVIACYGMLMVTLHSLPQQHVTAD